MMLWISSISGAPGSIPTSSRIGMRRLPKASNFARESQISLTRNFPSASKATWNSSPSGSQSPDFSRRRTVSSYCSVVIEAGVKRTSTLVARSSIVVGVADVGLVAMKASFVWVPSDGADLQPNTSHGAHLATEDSESEGALNVSRLVTIDTSRTSEPATLTGTNGASVGQRSGTFPSKAPLYAARRGSAQCSGMPLEAQTLIAAGVYEDGIQRRDRHDRRSARRRRPCRPCQRGPHPGRGEPVLV